MEERIAGKITAGRYKRAVENGVRGYLHNHLSAILEALERHTAETKIDSSRGMAGSTVEEQSPPRVHPVFQGRQISGQESVQGVSPSIAAFQKNHFVGFGQQRGGIGSFKAQGIPVAGAEYGIHGDEVTVLSPRFAVRRNQVSRPRRGQAIADQAM